MKKFLLLIATCSIAFASQAQGFKFGPRAGANFSTIKQNPKQKGWTNNFQTGFQAGLAFNVGITEMLSLQPEVLYSQKGFKSEFKSDFITASYEIKSSYIEVPVLAKVAFGSGNIKPFITAGPYAGYWLSGEIGDDEESESIDFDKAENDNLNRLDIGFNVGAGVALNAGPGQLTLDLRYGFSHISIDDEPEDADFFFTEGGYPTSKYQVLSASIAYLFGVKKK